METAQQVLIRYLEDCEAAERNFTHALATFAVTGEQNEVKRLFEMASQKAKTQHERLEKRLRELGGEPSTAKSILAHVLTFSTATAQLGHEPAEKNTQNLMMCVAAAAAEMAMYESLATVAQLAGDSQTEQLAKQLQKEEREDYEQSWNLLRPSADAAFRTVVQRHATA